MSNAMQAAEARWGGMLPADADRDERAAEAIKERLEKLDPETCRYYAEHAACVAEQDEDRARYIAQTEIGLGIVSMHPADWLELLHKITDRSPLLGAALKNVAKAIVDDLPAFMADEVDSQKRAGEQQ